MTTPTPKYFRKFTKKFNRKTGTENRQKKKQEKNCLQTYSWIIKTIKFPPLTTNPQQNNGKKLFFYRLAKAKKESLSWKKNDVAIN
jgi:hypothetical protein